METNERKIIDQLFQKLAQIAAQSGPRDPQAEASINKHVERIPGAVYYMAQTIIVQQQALKQAEAQLNELKQGRRDTQQPAPAQQPRSEGGFLAGAAQTALGIGGGILIADAAMGLTDALIDDAVMDALEDDIVDDLSMDLLDLDDW